MPKKTVIVSGVTGLFLLLLLGSWSFAEVGVTNDEIVIGTIQAMTGGMAYVGNQNVAGTKTMIAEINEKGGIICG